MNALLLVAPLTWLLSQPDQPVITATERAEAKSAARRSSSTAQPPVRRENLERPGLEGVELGLRGCVDALDRAALERMLASQIDGPVAVMVDVQGCDADRVLLTVRSGDAAPRETTVTLDDYPPALRHRAVGLVAAQLATAPPVPAEASARPVFRPSGQPSSSERASAPETETRSDSGRTTVLVDTSYGVGLGVDDLIEPYGLGFGLALGYTFDFPIYAGLALDIYPGGGESVPGIRELRGGAILASAELGVDLFPGEPDALHLRPTVGVGFARFLGDVVSVQQYPKLSFAFTPGVRLVLPVHDWVVWHFGLRLHIPTRRITESEKALSASTGIGFRM